MNKQLIIWFILCLNGTDYINAQWTETDSLRRYILEGNDSIRLNPETLKAIEDGTFLNRENPFNQLLEAPRVLPITKDFWDIAPKDSTRENIDFNTLPPSVAILKDLINKDSLKIIEDAFIFHLKTHERDQFQIGKLPVTVFAGGQSLHEKEVKDGQQRGTLGATTRVYFSLDDILSFLFRKSERQKKKNKKNAERLRNYYP